MNVFHAATGISTSILACGLFITGSVQPIQAQTRSRTLPGQTPRREHKPSADGPALVSPYRAEGARDPAPTLREMGDTVAVLPWNYKNSRDAAVQSAHEVCSQLLLGTGFNVFLIKSAPGTMPPARSGVSGSKKQDSGFNQILDAGRNFVTQDAPKKSKTVYTLPTLDDMIAAGEKLQSRYVLAGRAQWRSRNVWIGVSNRIKSICSVDLRILDMSTRRFVLDVHGIEGDSTENKNLYNSFTNIMALNPLPLVMPGSIGPYEQRAVTVAIARAMHPWLQSERIRAALSQADDSANVVEGPGPTGRFATLLTSLTDLQVILHVTTPDGKAPDLGDKELNRLYALHDVSLEYKEADHFRLSATSPKEGKQTLVINEDQRSFTVGDGKKVTHQDLSANPAKRSFLFEVCGLLTPGIFDTVRARFVQQETLEGVPTLVYDLTYWGLEDGPYQRVWIDPDRRLLLKRERFDAESVLRTIVLYRQPTEVGSNVWMPTTVDIQDGSRKAIATIKIARAQVNAGVSDNLFKMPTP
jgi:outer membrane lipoprotein-sorting protein